MIVNRYDRDESLYLQMHREWDNGIALCALMLPLNQGACLCLVKWTPSPAI